MRSSNAGSLRASAMSRRDDLVVALAVAVWTRPQGSTGRSRAERSGHHSHSRCEWDHRREQLPQFVECGALRPEHGAKDGVERDAHHRLQRLELAALGPAARSRASPLLRRSLHSRPSACHGTAAPAACGAARCSSPSRLKVEPGPSTVPSGRPGNEVAVGGEQILDHSGSLTTRSSPKIGRFTVKALPYRLASDGDSAVPRGDESDAHESLWYPRRRVAAAQGPWWPQPCRPSVLVLQGTANGTPLVPIGTTPFPHTSNNGTV